MEEKPFRGLQKQFKSKIRSSLFASSLKMYRVSWKGGSIHDITPLYGYLINCCCSSGELIDYALELKSSISSTDSALRSLRVHFLIKEGSGAAGGGGV